MSRTPKGTIERNADGTELRVRVTVRDDHGEAYRPWVDLPPRLTDDAARRVALRWAEERQGKPRARVVNGRKLSASPTWDEYFTKLWVPSRTRKVKSLSDDVGRWKNHLKPLLGDKHMDETSAEDLRRVVEALDAKANDPAQPKFGPGSAVNCWTIVTTMIDDACNSKQEKLRLLKVNPALGVKPPDPPDEVEKQWLFPVELQKLLACSAVPLERRRLYAAATYCCARPGEALGLLWRAGVDVEHDMVRINRAWDSRKERFNEYTKSGDSRHFRIEPVLRPMFVAMFKRRRTELVFPTISKLAETLRADLLTAGVDRPALHKPKSGAELMRFHDLRATGITYMAMRGDTDQEVRERAGHTDIKTTLMYIRRGHQALGAAIGVPFAPLPAELLGIVPELSPPPGSGGVTGETGSGIVEREKGFEPSERPPGTEKAEETDRDGSSDEPASDPEDPLGRFRDDSFAAALLSANAVRGQRLAAFVEVDQTAALPGLLLCRALESLYRGDRVATIAALVAAGRALGLADPERWQVPLPGTLTIVTDDEVASG